MVQQVRPAGEVSVDVDADHLSVRADEFGEQGARVPGAGADLKHPRPGRDVQGA